MMMQHEVWLVKIAGTLAVLAPTPTPHAPQFAVFGSLLRICDTKKLSSIRIDKSSL
jgi:hypothetical protein